MHTSTVHSLPSFRSRWLHALALVAALIVLPPLQRAAQGQSTSQQQPSDGPPSGLPPDGGGPGGPPASSSSSGDSGSTSGSVDSSTPGSTQGRRLGPPSPTMELDRITKAMKAASLPLSDAQKVTILGVLEDKETAMEALRTSTTDRAAAMQQVQALEQSSRAAILAVLTEAQQAIYTAMRQAPPPRPGSGSSSSPTTSRIEQFTNTDAAAANVRQCG